jgi:hypothetical protein
VTGEDSAEYRRRIADLLVLNGFDWVVAQTDAEIAEGKQSSKQVSERETSPLFDDKDFQVRQPRSRRATLVTSEHYSGAERLEILLQAIEAALIQRSAVEHAVLAEMPDVTIHFVPDAPATGLERSVLERQHDLSAERASLASELEANTRTIIESVRRESRADTG